MSLLLLLRPLMDFGTPRFHGVVSAPGSIKRKKRKKATKELLLEAMTPREVRALIRETPIVAAVEDDDLELFMLMGWV